MLNRGFIEFCTSFRHVLATFKNNRKNGKFGSCLWSLASLDHPQRPGSWLLKNLYYCMVFKKQMFFHVFPKVSKPQKWAATLGCKAVPLLNGRCSTQLKPGMICKYTSSRICRNQKPKTK